MNFMTGRYDDLGCVYGGLQALLQTKPGNYIDILAVFDNEEVGSLTRQGADSTFLPDTLHNISDGLKVSNAVMRTWIADSFLLECRQCTYLAIPISQVRQILPTDLISIMELY